MDAQIFTRVSISAGRFKSCSGNPTYAFIMGIGSRDSPSRITSGSSMAETNPSSYRPNLPALPAICLISSGVRVRLFTPSNFLVSTNTILRMGRLSPIPMASVLTTTSVSFARKRRTCSLLVAGGRLPYITLQWLPSFSRWAARASTDFLENTINASPFFRSLFRLYGLDSMVSLVFLLWRTTRY